MTARAFLATVFGDAVCIGNPTGVVWREAPIAPERAQWVAAQLGVPDTVFLWREGEAYAARFYSPTEALSVCYQALLAAGHVLDLPQVTFRLADRELVVERADGLGWVLTPTQAVRREGTVVAPSGGLAQVIDTGRRRAFLQVAAETLQGFRWSPEEALGWLQSHGLSGLCLVHEGTTGEVALRVFTTSLEGREDVATGGAVAALPALLGRRERVEVRQGVGPPHRRGVLYVEATEEAVRVGGACRVHIAGALAE